jgi:hypothetical protein
MPQILSVSANLVGVSFGEVIQIMTDTSWDVRDVQGVSYLPIDAQDVGDWTLFSEESVEVAIEICCRRAGEGKVAGVVLLLKDTESGGSFVWADERNLLVSLSVNVSNRWDLNRWTEAIVRPLDMHSNLESFSLSWG